MKKRDVINLIKYFSENNPSAFKDVAFEIARDFNANGDTQLGNYIFALLSDKNTFIPQAMYNKSDYLRKIDCLTSDVLPLPNSITGDLKGIINAIGYNAGINKFLFSGAPGTGKTESTKQLARITGRELFIVDFEGLVDSKLGQTSKNIAELFEEINNLPYPDRVIILFDEIDSLAMDRVDSRDLREMGRATSSVLKGFDSLNPNVVIIATTNLIDSFDKALLRRFDKIIDFNRYSQEELADIAEMILEDQLLVFKFAGRDMKLFRKVIRLLNPLPYPGDLKNMIKSAIAFSSPSDNKDYLKRLFSEIMPNFSGELNDYKKLGFTVREIELLSGISKSKISRDLVGDRRDE